MQTTRARSQVRFADMMSTLRRDLSSTFVEITQPLSVERRSSPRSKEVVSAETHMHSTPSKAIQTAKIQSDQWVACVRTHASLLGGAGRAFAGVEKKPPNTTSMCCLGHRSRARRRAHMHARLIIMWA